MLMTLVSKMGLGMRFDAPTLLPLLAVAALFLWCIIRPNVGRLLARIFAVFAIGGGIGVLTWGICSAALGAALRSPFGLTSLIAEPSEAIGWGTGALAAGITALVLSFIGGRKVCDKREKA